MFKDSLMRSDLNDLANDEELTAEDLEYIKKMQSEIFGNENGSEAERAHMRGQTTAEALSDMFSRMDEEQAM